MSMRLLMLFAFFSISAFLEPTLGSALSQGSSQVIVCRDRQDQIISVENFDLYFARVFMGSTLVEFEPDQSHVDIALTIAQKVGRGGGGQNPTVIHTERSRGQLVSSDFNIMNFDGKEYQQHFAASVQDVDDHKVLLESGYRLKLKDPDAALPIESGCEREQISSFDPDQSQLRIVSDYWRHLDSRGKGAVLVHEALHRNLLLNHVEDWGGAGQAVAYAFSEGSVFEWLMEGVPEDSLRCRSTDESMAYRFFAYPDSDGSVIFQFLMLEGELLLTKSFIRVTKKYSPFAGSEDGLADTTYSYLEAPFSRGAQVALSTAFNKGKRTFKMQLDLGDLGEDLKYSIECKKPDGRSHLGQP